MRTRDELRESHALNRTERELLHAMLPIGHEHRAAVLQQAEAASVIWLDASGQPAILFEVDSSVVPPLSVPVRVLAEAEVTDRDGVVMHLLLHLTEGYLREVEVYREDGKAVIEFPAISALSIL